MSTRLKIFAVAAALAAGMSSAAMAQSCPPGYAPYGGVCQPSPAYAPGPVSGAAAGEAAGASSGAAAAGPVGALIGGALGTATGAVTGTANAVTKRRNTERDEAGAKAFTNGSPRAAGF